MSFEPSVRWLPAAIPAAAVLDGTSAPAPLLFFSAALAVVPLAALIVHGTERLVFRTGRPSAVC
jgi:Ca2+:H+ antiporter